jgi:hypothetical protein
VGPAIQRVSEAGGVAVTVNKSEGQVHSTPQFLPARQRFLYVVTGDRTETNGIYVSALEEGAQPVRLVADISVARYSSPVAPGQTGHLMFLRGATLMAQPFDPETLRLFADVFRVAEPVTQFSVSENGALAYTSGASVPRQELVWIDRSGRTIKSGGPLDEHSNFRLSRDETRIVFNRTGANPDIWVLDMGRGVPVKITSDPGVDNLPIWSHDELRILWRSKRSGYFDLYVKAATGAGPDELFIEMGTPSGWGTDWSRDGKSVLYQRPGEKTGQDLWIAPQSPERSSGAQKPFPYLHSPFNERNAVFSPDGRWVAYESDESGRLEVYVQAFPLTGEKHQISLGGGASPAWRADGAELFYQAADRNLMAVPVRPTQRRSNRVLRRSCFRFRKPASEATMRPRSTVNDA